MNSVTYIIYLKSTIIVSGSFSSDATVASFLSFTVYGGSNNFLCDILYGIPIPVTP